MVDGQNVPTREETIAAARAAGFPLAGCAPIAPLPRAGLLEGWLAEGRAGEMGHLARRTAERTDPPLAAALIDPEPLVRSHAAWALGELGGREARDALNRAHLRESDPAAASEVDAARSLL